LIISTASSGAGKIGKVVSETVNQGLNIAADKADKISAARANYGSSFITSLFLVFAFVAMFN
jgi:hypothetical protein